MAFYSFLLSVLALSTGYGQAQTTSVPLGIGITISANGNTKHETITVPSGGSFADSLDGSITGPPTSTAKVQVQVSSPGPNQWQIKQTIQASGNSNAQITVNWGYNVVGAGLTFTSTASATLAGSVPGADVNVYSNGVLGLCVALSPLYNQGVRNCMNVVAPTGTWTYKGQPSDGTGSAQLECLSAAQDDSCNATIFTVVVVGKCSTAPPTVQDLVRLATDAWEPTHHSAGDYNVVSVPMKSSDGGTSAIAYGSGSQVVIAAAGLKNSPNGFFAKPNLVADESFIVGNTPTNTLVNGVNNLASLVQYYATHHPDFCITLTGVSEGGAIAQIVGTFANVQTVTFAAPGSNQLLSYFRGNPSSFLSSLPGLQIPTPVIEFDNYRFYGDQLSLMGQPIGTQITVTPADLRAAVNNVNLTYPSNWIPEITDIHSGAVLQNALLLSGAPQVPGVTGSWTGSDGVSWPPAQNVTALSPMKSNDPTTFTSCNVPSCAGPDYTSQWVPVLQGIAQGLNTYRSSWLTVQNFKALVSGGTPSLWDPSAGYLYTFVSTAGSPELASILLPTFDSVAGENISWTLTYYTATGLSKTVTSSTGAFNFGPGIRHVAFYPVDAAGNPVAYQDSLLFVPTFSSSGTVNATLSTFTTSPHKRLPHFSSER